MFSRLRQKTRLWSPVTKFFVAFGLLVTFLCISGFSIFYFTREFWQDSLSSSYKPLRPDHAFSPNTNGNSSLPIKAKNGEDNSGTVTDNKQRNDNNEKVSKTSNHQKKNESSPNSSLSKPESFESAFSFPFFNNHNKKKNNAKKKKRKNSKSHAHNHDSDSKELESLIRAYDSSLAEEIANMTVEETGKEEKKKKRRKRYNQSSLKKDKRLQKRDYSSSKEDDSHSNHNNSNTNSDSNHINFNDNSDSNSIEKLSSHSSDTDNPRNHDKPLYKKKKRSHYKYHEDCSDCELKIKLVKGMSKEKQKDLFKKHKKIASIYKTYKKHIQDKKKQERKTVNKNKKKKNRKEKETRGKGDKRKIRTKAEFLKNLLLVKEKVSNDSLLPPSYPIYKVVNDDSIDSTFSSIDAFDHNKDSDKRIIGKSFDEIDSNAIGKNNIQMISPPPPQRYASTGQAGRHGNYRDYVNSLSKKNRKKEYSYLAPLEMFETSTNHQHGKKRSTKTFLKEIEDKKKRRRRNYKKWLREKEFLHYKNNLNSPQPRPFVPEEEGLTDGGEPTRELGTNLDDKIKSILGSYFTQVSKKKSELEKAFNDSEIDERDPPLRSRDIKKIKLLQSALVTPIKEAISEAIIDPKTRLIQNMTPSEMFILEKSNEEAERERRREERERNQNFTITTTPLLNSQNPQMIKKTTTSMENASRVRISNGSPQIINQTLTKAFDAKGEFERRGERKEISNTNNAINLKSSPGITLIPSNNVMKNDKNENFPTNKESKTKKKREKNGNDNKSDDSVSIFNVSSSDENINPQIKSILDESKKEKTIVKKKNFNSKDGDKKAKEKRKKRKESKRSSPSLSISSSKSKKITKKKGKREKDKKKRNVSNDRLLGESSDSSGKD